MNDRKHDGKRGFTVSVCLAALASAPAQGQWVSFDDETATRLVLNAFADAPQADPTTDAQEKDFAVADLDRDGDSDVIVVRKEPFSVAGARQDVLLMNQNGVLTDRTADLAAGFLGVLTDSRDVFIGEFTGDIWDDVVIASTFQDPPRFYRNLGEDNDGNWLGLSDETSIRFPVIAVPGDVSTLQFCALWGGDVTGNGAMDIYFSNYNPGQATTDVLFVNDGAGVFSIETDDRLGNYANVAFGTSVEIHDVDNDTDMDIVKISTLYSAAPFPVGQFILFNDGNGDFDTTGYQDVGAASPYMFTVADFNGDGVLDQYFESDDQDAIALAQSVTTDSVVSYAVTQLSVSPRTADFGGNTKTADIDGDGDLDVAVAPIDVDIQNCGSSSEFALLRNDGDGAFDDPWLADDSQNIHTDPHDFAFLDVNGDSCMDIVMGLCTGWRVFVQNPCIPDTDSDGLHDSFDNCTLVPNPAQVDTNGDNIGNRCDTDIDGDCAVNFADLAALKAGFTPVNNPDADFDANGLVGFGDLARMKQTFFNAAQPGPGPSGLPNACSP